ncbi:MAG: hypothetical protein ACRC92_26585 [Peptostreptococcaceae bacterium]
MKLTQMQKNERVLYGAPKNMPEDIFKSCKKTVKRLNRFIKRDYRELSKLIKGHANLLVMEDKNRLTIYSLNDFNKSCKMVDGIKLYKDWRSYTIGSGKHEMLTLYMALNALRDDKGVDQDTVIPSTISLGVHRYDNLSENLMKEMAEVVIDVAKR